MKKLRMPDEFVLACFEKVSHRIQRWCGVKSCTLKRCFVILGLFAYMCELAQLPAWHFVATPLVVIALMSLYYKDSSSNDDSDEAAFRNPESELQWPVRTLFLTVIVLNSFTDGIRLFEWFQLATAAHYFHAVTDLPEAPSKLREFIDSFSASQEVNTEAA